MQAVLEYIADRQSRLAGHPFFAELSPDGPLEELLAFAPRLAPWVSTFQQVLRICSERATAPALRELVRQHAKEEGGHDRWYEQDVQLLFGPQPERPPAPGARDAARRLLAEAESIDADELRLVMLMAMEATSGIFFTQIAPLVARREQGSLLAYFGPKHLASERAHAVFEEEAERRLRALVLSPVLRARAVALVDRTFASFELLFNGLRGARPEEWASAPPARLRSDAA